MSRQVEVKYQIATYSGRVSLEVDENDDNETIKAKARSFLKNKCGGSLPYGYESYKISE